MLTASSWVRPCCCQSRAAAADRPLHSPNAALKLQRPAGTNLICAWATVVISFMPAKASATSGSSLWLSELAVRCRAMDGETRCGSTPRAAQVQRAIFPPWIAGLTVFLVRASHSLQFALHVLAAGCVGMAAGGLSPGWSRSRYPLLCRWE